MAHAASDPTAVTMNMNGKTGKGFAKRRRSLIKRVLTDVNPEVVFGQELPAKFEEMIDDLTTENKWPDWDFVKVETEAGVMWDTSKFKGTKDGFRSTDTRMIKIREKLGKTEASNLLSRAAFVKLTRKDDNTSFIAVSYHGEYKTKKQREIFDCLVDFLERLSKEEKNIPFLIGGDFNFNTLSSPQKKVTFATYKLLPRASEKGKIQYKDNFCWSKKEPSDESDGHRSRETAQMRSLLSSTDIPDTMSRQLERAGLQGMSLFNVFEAQSHRDVKKHSSRSGPFIEMPDLIEVSPSKATAKVSQTRKNSRLKMTTNKEPIAMRDVYAYDIGKDNYELLDHDPIYGKLHLK
ncbi:uncharacterized protein LOC110253633 isoform X2 [Exaiptasia diaphana]|uniref:Endonuclease/exonuclease/phosphatase domain-containing protein n=1 Tax=Exaiptasia diaphana TaxID=2652724 RepID=A0A913Y9F4_EXADI|nr:uncharacterized protein LOC110253633 isoform X2 [Exaiptasia diaphana]